GVWFVKQGIDGGNGALGAASGFLLTALLVLGAFIPVPATRILCAAPPLVPLAVYLLVVTTLGEPVRALLTGRSAANDGPTT
ncbi:MAG: hypothetical protein ABI175_05995, partial [Polyangiales bacterium]